MRAKKAILWIQLKNGQTIKLDDKWPASNGGVSDLPLNVWAIFLNPKTIDVYEEGTEEFEGDFELIGGPDDSIAPGVKMIERDETHVQHIHRSEVVRWEEQCNFQLTAAYVKKRSAELEKDALFEAGQDGGQSAAIS